MEPMFRCPQCSTRATAMMVLEAERADHLALHAACPACADGPDGWTCISHTCADCGAAVPGDTVEGHRCLVA